MLADGQHALLLRSDGDTRGGMGVQHARHIVANFMDGTVDGVARRIDFVGAVHQFVAGLIDLDQAGRGDLVEHQPIRVDQEIIGARHLGRDMGEDQVIPAMQRHQAIAGRQVDAGLPFGSADLVIDILRR